MKIILISILLSSCAYKVVPIKGQYTNGNFEAYSDKPKDQVWENIIDFFAKSGLSIKIIDRSSGLIISERTEMPWSYENSKGALVKPGAWVVIGKIIDPGSRKAVAPYQVSGEWNIRIKEVDGKTLINVNLTSPHYRTSMTIMNYTMFRTDQARSTGIFESLVYNKVR